MEQTAGATLPWCNKPGSDCALKSESILIILGVRGYRKSCIWHKMKFRDHYVNEWLCRPSKSNTNVLRPKGFFSPDLGDPNQKAMFLDLDAKIKASIVMVDLKFLFIYFQREKKGGRKKHQHVVASWVSPPSETQPATQACALTGNWTGDPLVRRPALNPLSHTNQGLMVDVLKRMTELTNKNFIKKFHLRKMFTLYWGRAERKRQKSGMLLNSQSVWECGQFVTAGVINRPDFLLFLFIL